MLRVDLTFHQLAFRKAKTGFAFIAHPQEIYNEVHEHERGWGKTMRGFS